MRDSVTVVDIPFYGDYSFTEITIESDRPGPTILLSAGVHKESAPLGTMELLKQKLMFKGDKNWKLLAGKVVLFDRVNPYALENGTRGGPNGGDLNKRGSDEYIQACSDAYIERARRAEAYAIFDLHGSGNKPRKEVATHPILFPEPEEHFDHMYDLTAGAGFGYGVIREKNKNGGEPLCRRTGLPACAIEVKRGDEEIALQAVGNILQNKRMLPGQPSLRKRLRLYDYEEAIRQGAFRRGPGKLTHLPELGKVYDAGNFVTNIVRPDGTVERVDTGHSPALVLGYSEDEVGSDDPGFLLRMLPENSSVNLEDNSSGAYKAQWVGSWYPDSWDGEGI